MRWLLNEIRANVWFTITVTDRLFIVSIAQLRFAHFSRADENLIFIKTHDIPRLSTAITETCGLIPLLILQCAAEPKRRLTDPYY
jgi:hypothetical protein